MRLFVVTGVSSCNFANAGQTKLILGTQFLFLFIISAIACDLIIVNRNMTQGSHNGIDNNRKCKGQ